MTEVIIISYFSVCKYFHFFEADTYWRDPGTILHALKIAHIKLRFFLTDQKGFLCFPNSYSQHTQTCLSDYVVN